MQDHELDALSEAMETIEAARVAIGAVLCMFAPSHPETDKERTDQEIALMLLEESKQHHPAGCLPHLRAVEREIAVMGSALAYEALRRVTEAKKRNE